MQPTVSINPIGTTSGVHRHDHQQIMIGLQGRMQCELPGQSGALTRGATGFVPAATEHRYAGRDDGCRVLVLDFLPDDPLIAAIGGLCGASVSAALLETPRLDRARGSLVQLLDWYEQHGRLRQLPIQAVRQQVLAHLLTELVVTDLAPPARPAASTRLSAQRLQEWVDARLHEPIAVAELANAFHLSESHLYVLFARLFGCAPAAYIRTRRLQQAHRLLSQTALPVQAIAERTGFADSTALGKAFKRAYGTSPSRLRQS